MSKATANTLTHSEASRIAALNPEQADLRTADIGSAVLGILTASTAVGRVKDRVAELDQQELMQLIDDEVDAARAGRP